MKLRFTACLPVFVLLLMLALPITPAWADELKLKNGQEFSGKFLRGDASVVEFRIGGKIQTFRTTDVLQIIFKEPELTTPTPKRADVGPPTETSSTVRQVPVKERTTRTATFTAGTPITIRTTHAIDTDHHKIGDSFTATLEEPLTTDGQVVVPQGALVKGVIAVSKESGRLSGKSELALELTKITADGRDFTLNTGEYTEVGSSRGSRTAKTVGGTAALGAIIGAIAGGGKGAAVGAAAGAAAGTGVQILTKGQTLKIPAETVLEFKLESLLSVPIP